MSIEILLAQRWRERRVEVKVPGLKTETGAQAVWYFPLLSFDEYTRWSPVFREAEDSAESMDKFAEFITSRCENKDGSLVFEGVSHDFLSKTFEASIVAQISYKVWNESQVSIEEAEGNS